jgi:hypothetical protein
MTKRPSRRSALKALGAAAAAPIVAPGALVAQSAALDTQTLAAIADAVLPDAMGADARRRVVTDFLRWIKGYREGAETDHGYGVTRIRTTGPSPAARYPAQLTALDKAAKAQGSARFRDLSIEQRRAAIEAALSDAKIERLPGRPSGGHIAADVMAFYFNSAAAFDLCYRAKIDRDACRGLDGSENEPKT